MARQRRPPHLELAGWTPGRGEPAAQAQHRLCEPFHTARRRARTKPDPDSGQGRRRPVRLLREPRGGTRSDRWQATEGPREAIHVLPGLPRTNRHRTGLCDCQRAWLRAARHDLQRLRQHGDGSACWPPRLPQGGHIRPCPSASDESRHGRQRRRHGRTPRHGYRDLRSARLHAASRAARGRVPGQWLHRRGRLPGSGRTVDEADRCSSTVASARPCGGSEDGRATTCGASICRAAR